MAWRLGFTKRPILRWTVSGLAKAWIASVVGYLSVSLVDSLELAAKITEEWFYDYPNHPWDL